jgi:hypothetical protein
LKAGTIRCAKIPLQLFGFHYKARTHSSYGNVDVLKAACRQEVWINPLDAEKRGIKTAIWCASSTTAASAYSGESDAAHHAGRVGDGPGRLA